MSNIKLFESKQIRTVWNQADEKWYFVVADAIQVLTDTPNPSDYIKKMRKRDEELSKELSDQIIPNELLLSIARFRFIWFNKCKRYLGLKKMCKLVTGLLTKKCKLFSGRDKAKEYTKHCFWLNNTYVRDEIYLK